MYQANKQLELLQREQEWSRYLGYLEDKANPRCRIGE
jgi:hypothetical protein